MGRRTAKGWRRSEVKVPLPQPSRSGLAGVVRTIVGPGFGPLVKAITPDDVVGIFPSVDAAAAWLQRRPRYVIVFAGTAEFYSQHVRHHPQFGPVAEARWWWDRLAAENEMERMRRRDLEADLQVTTLEAADAAALAVA